MNVRGMSWIVVDCRGGKILINHVGFNKIDSFLINKVQIIQWAQRIFHKTRMPKSLIYVCIYHLY